MSDTTTRSVNRAPVRIASDVVGGVLLGVVFSFVVPAVLTEAVTGLSGLSQPALIGGLAVLTIVSCVGAFYAPRAIAIAGALVLVVGMAGLLVPAATSGDFEDATEPIVLAILGAALVGASAVRFISGRTRH